MIVWHKGPPPSVGWWPTLAKTPTGELLRDIRWYDGTGWSVHCTQRDADAKLLRRVSSLKASPALAIQWGIRPKSWLARSKKVPIVWNSGPPPSVGWWPTLAEANTGGVFHKNIRWYDGARWGCHCTQENAEGNWLNILYNAPTAFDQSKIRWRDRPKSWPARSKT